MPKEMMIRNRINSKKTNKGSALRMSILNSKTLHVKCTCHENYEYKLRIDTTLRDKDLDTMSNPDFLQWVEDNTGLSYQDLAKLHKDFADLTPEERRIPWDGI